MENQPDQEVHMLAMIEVAEKTTATGSGAQVPLQMQSDNPEYMALYREAVRNIEARRAQAADDLPDVDSV